MTLLKKVLFFLFFFYGSMVWINHHNKADFNKLWCKVSKFTLGATFSIKLEPCKNHLMSFYSILFCINTVCIIVQNLINIIKYFLKLNIQKDDNNPLRMLMVVMQIFRFSAKLADFSTEWVIFVNRPESMRKI